MNDSCAICVENFNQTKNKPVSCPYCEFKSCRCCCETYFLNETVVKCMNNTCGKTWSRKFINDNFTAAFINGSLKKHVQDVFFEKERALLPATQPHVVEEIRNEKLVLLKKDEREERKKYKLQFRSMENRLSVMSALTRQSYEDEYQKILDDEKDRLRIIKHNYRLKQRELLAEGGIQATRNEIKSFVRACPEEACRGFLNSQWKCTLCEKWTCPDCHVVKGLERDCEHTCKPDDVATAKLLASDTKPCPKCSTSIFKIDGCDQMFCTQCHTAFGWKTGNIEYNIHNPHYFEWLRKNRNENPERNPLDIVCGQEIDFNFTVHMNDMLNKKKPLIDTVTKVMNLCRQIIHIRAVELPKFFVDDVTDNQSLRIQYMRNKLNEQEFKSKLFTSQKNHDIKREIRDVLIMFLNVVTDIIYRYYEQLKISKTSVQVNNCRFVMNDVNPLILYVQECFDNISENFKSAKYIIKIDHYFDDMSIDKISLAQQKKMNTVDL